jgi:flagellar motor protein MotB
VKVDVVAIIAPTDNFIDFENALTAVKGNLVSTLGWKGSRLSTVLADSSPNIEKSDSIPGRDNQTDGEIVAGNSVSQLSNVYNCVVKDPDFDYTGNLAADSEADFLQALTTASNSFDATSPESQKRILVLGNGIQTSGQFNFVENGIPDSSQISQIISNLKKEDALPNLQGATVDWIGLGQTDGSKQQKLNQQSLNSLRAFWEAVITASNGYPGIIQMEISSGQPAKGSIKTTNITALPDACVEASVTAEEGFNFEPNTANFIDINLARKGAQSIAAKISEQPNCKGDLTVIGYTASGVPQSKFQFGQNLFLSQQRAEAFKQLLVEAGVVVPIIAIGGDKGPINDWDQNGNFVEELGKQNRKVDVRQQ